MGQRSGQWSTSLRAALALLSAGALTAGCTVIGGEEEQETGPVTVTLVTHQSWAVPQEVVDAFEQRAGVRIEVRKEGDAGELTNKLVLTKDNPIADVAFGIDSTFASRALSEGVFQPYTSPEADRGPQRYAVDPQQRLSAVDVGDVCVNIDTEWFAENDVPEPTSLEDLTEPEYEDLFVVPSPATSSPGLAFLFATVSEFGEDGGWREYWGELKDNGVKVVSGWTEAYTQDFSGSSGEGDRPIVLSYASSPAAEIGPDGTPRTKALLDTCYRQVEYAGVLEGTQHPDEAGKVIDFLLSHEFQSTVAENMFVYPTREGVALPEGWAQAAPLPREPISLSGEQVQANREQWIKQWRGLLEG
ncbi:thiamine ABC transporter substrate-binding protein [Saccharomonospora azurea]|uniref:ABC transporter periplasmic binding protein, thiB subfamily n=1 Tax=Saccharomonospora azurea NA-128 TaxID=882081 RepID=H8GCF4_9PSEU|nr:thiamine ABC transporter substrate-binding protein [Saccharomonospora azurea]EHK87757.1 ABC transporter periplasmic binding protein, thiB subfamily [Saccharomonospora azurea SZMC 14600]EHY88788.1 ABC transporter periplasmic binding protein, thiB subfamily [Saccharomonospora azurea NA-128]